MIKAKPSTTKCIHCGTMIEPKMIGSGPYSRWSNERECTQCKEAKKQSEEVERQKRWIRERRREQVENVYGRIITGLRSDSPEYDRRYRRSKATSPIPQLFRYARMGKISKTLQDVLLGIDSVYLWGSPGTGKTYASMASMREESIRINTVCRMQFESLLSRLREFNETEDSILKPFFDSCVVILDDVGQSSSEYAAKILYRIIDTRLENLKKTILISNLSPENFGGVYGDRMFSRIKTYRVIQLDGEDKRDKKIKIFQNSA